MVVSAAVSVSVLGTRSVVGGNQARVSSVQLRIASMADGGAIISGKAEEAEASVLRLFVIVVKVAFKIAV